MMMNFTDNLKSLLKPASIPGGVPAPMADAMAMVRQGRLQDASDLLMGRSTAHDVAGQEKGHSPSAPEQRLPNWVARGLASAHEALAHLDLRAGGFAATPADATVASTTASHPAAPSLSAAPGRFERVELVHQGASHAYFLYIPQTAVPAGGRPLVLMLHGCTQNAQDFAQGTRMNSTAEAAGALVLYPTQSQSANAHRCWNWFRPEDQQSGAGEPALLHAMLRHTIASQPVDPQRVFVAGLSAGGAMAAVMAQQYPHLFTAVGVHSGLPTDAATSMMGALSAMKSGAKGWCASSTNSDAKVVPLIVMHGDADKTVHKRNGEQLFQSAAAGVATTVQTQEEGTSSDGQRYTRTSLLNPKAPGKVIAEHWLLHGAGHMWSGGDARGSYTSAHGVDASAQMMHFFLMQAAHAAPVDGL